MQITGEGGTGTNRSGMLMDALYGDTRRISPGSVGKSLAEGQFGLIGQQAPVYGAQDIAVRAVLQHDPLGQQWVFDLDQPGGPDQCFARPGCHVAAERCHSQRGGDRGQSEPTRQACPRNQPNDPAREPAWRLEGFYRTDMSHGVTVGCEREQSSRNCASKPKPQRRFSNFRITKLPFPGCKQSTSSGSAVQRPSAYQCIGISSVHASGHPQKDGPVPSVLF